RWAHWQLPNQRFFDTESADWTVPDAAQRETHSFAPAAVVQRHERSGATHGEVARTPRYLQKRAARTTRHTWHQYLRQELARLERCCQIATEEIGSCYRTC